MKKTIQTYLFNRYTLILLAFSIWMYFFDDNSIRIHQELNRDIKKLEASIAFYKNEISKDKEIIEIQNDSEKLERFARENYQMKKKNEDIYIIEFDSLND